MSLEGDLARRLESGDGDAEARFVELYSHSLMYLLLHLTPSDD